MPRSFYGCCEQHHRTLSPSARFYKLSRSFFPNGGSLYIFWKDGFDPSAIIHAIADVAAKTQTRTVELSGWKEDDDKPLVLPFALDPSQLVLQDSQTLALDNLCFSMDQAGPLWQMARRIRFGHCLLQDDDADVLVGQLQSYRVSTVEFLGGRFPISECTVCSLFENAAKSLGPKIVFDADATKALLDMGSVVRRLQRLGAHAIGNGVSLSTIQFPYGELDQSTKDRFETFIADLYYQYLLMSNSGHDFALNKSALLAQLGESVVWPFNIDTGAGDLASKMIEEVESIEMDFDE